MKLAKLEAKEHNQSAEADLRWFWNEADGDMGVRSSFPAMVARLECGGATGGRPIMEIADHCLEAAGRARIISRALHELPEHHQRVLGAAFGPCAHELPGLGMAAPVAPMTEAALAAHKASGTDRSIEEWLVRLCARVNSKKARASNAQDRLAFEAIRDEAQASLRRAVNAFDVAHLALRSQRRSRFFTTGQLDRRWLEPSGQTPCHREEE